MAATVTWAAGSGGAAAAVFLLVRTVQRQGRTDPDTGLPNGFGLAQLVRQQGDWSTYLVATMSLDGIGDARQALGYRTGTELVRRAVEDIGQVLPPSTLIGRVVADELVVLQRLCTPSHPQGGGDGTEGYETGVEVGGAEEEAEAVATGLVKAIRSGRYLADGVEVAFRAHVGMALAPWDGTDVEELIRKASLSAPRAVASGRLVARWDGGTGTLTAADLALLADLRLAGERGELSLAYQPKVSLRQRRAVSVEALLRWKSPSHGQVPPDRFIVLAERTGLIDRITEWVFQEALDAQVRWRAAGWHIPVAVNVSAKSLSRPDLPDWMLAQLLARDIPAETLTVEITETAAPEDLARAVALLRPLYQRGVRISIDDFGVGYTSLSVLPHLPLSQIKVDQGFVRRASTSPTDEAIVRTVLELGRRLGLEVVAEGVEDEQVCRLVADAGYDMVQGYHFSRPLYERDLLAFFASRCVFEEVEPLQSREPGDVGVHPPGHSQALFVPHEETSEEAGLLDGHDARADRPPEIAQSAPGQALRPPAAAQALSRLSRVEGDMAALLAHDAAEQLAEDRATGPAGQ